MEAACQSQSPVSTAAPGPRRARLSRLLPVAAAVCAGAALRLWMLGQFFLVNGDALIYGGLAKNLLLHGRYALTANNGEVYPTLIRLPGYPIFLACCFRIFGMENYASAAWVQIALDLAGCLLLADCARLLAPPRHRSRVALATLWLAALCPFTAIYAVEPLAEALTLFSIALALWAAARFTQRPAWASALCFTFAVCYATLLRPDGALLGVALAPALVSALGLGGRGKTLPDEGYGLQPPREHNAENPLGIQGFSAAGKGKTPFRSLAARLKHFWKLCRPEFRRYPTHSAEKSGMDGAPKVYSKSKNARKPRLLPMALVCLLLALAPFALWAVRNWQVFHVFEPLAPRYANDPGEEVHAGLQRWTKTWCLDFVSTYDLYWNLPGDRFEVSKLPIRAFDSPAQYAATVALAADYNRTFDLTPELDRRFEHLAQERIAAHPARSYLWLPLGRLGDMLLRPRVENLPVDLDWWVYAHHPAETLFAWSYAVLNALYLLLGLAGLALRPRLGLSMLGYLLLRSALLMTIEAPEARYTLEFFPMLFVLAAIRLCSDRPAATQKRGVLE